MLGGGSTAALSIARCSPYSYHRSMTDIDHSLATQIFASLQHLAELSAKLCTAVQGLESDRHELDAQPFVVVNGQISVPVAGITLATKLRPIVWRPGSPVPTALEWIFYASEEMEPAHFRRIGHLYVTPYGTQTQFRVLKGDSPGASHELTLYPYPEFLKDLRAWVICRLHELGHFAASKSVGS